MSFYYLSVPGIPGAVQATGHVGWIEVAAFEWGKNRTFTVTKAFDASSGNFYQACATGRVFDEVLLDIVKEDFFSSVSCSRAHLQSVVVSSIQPGPRSDGDSTEVVTFTGSGVRFEDPYVEDREEF